MRLRELYESIQLDENYNGKVDKLKRLPAIAANPNLLQDFDARLTWAKQAFKDKNQPMLWYISLYEAWLLQEQDPNAKAKLDTMLGGFPDFSFPAFEQSMDHWLNSVYAERRQVQEVVKKINAQTTTVDALVQNLQAAETAIKSEDEANAKKSTPVEILPGDQVILPLGNQGDWWLLPTNSHKAESKVMGHCGTAGKAKNVLLSLRDKTPIPWVTMEYDKDQGVLHQMKGRNNSKPANKFHYAILELLKSDLVNGIFTGQTYQPASDFSIFDMNEDLINQLLDPASGKPHLIKDQIAKYPIDFLRAPEKTVRSNPDFRNFAVSQLPGLSIIVDESGVTSNDNNTWERAIEDHPTMIIYSPVTLTNWENRVTKHLVKNHRELGYCGNHIRSNYNIMKEVITHGAPAAIEVVPYRAPHYKELAVLAIGRSPELIKSVNTEGWSKEESKKAWMNAAHKYLGTEDWPDNLFTPEDDKELWRTQVKNDRYAISKLPSNLFNEQELTELWGDATKAHPGLLNSTMFNELPIAEETKDQMRIATVFAHPDYIAEFRPDLIENENDRIKLWTKACDSHPNLITMLKYAAIPNRVKIELTVKTVRDNPAYITDVDQSLIPDEDERVDLWIKACNSRPSYKDSPLFPAEAFNRNPAKLKALWISMFDTSFNHDRPRLSELPEDLFTPEELTTLIRKVIDKDPGQIVYAPPSMTTPKERITAIKDLMNHDPWIVMQMKQNPTPPELYTREQIKETWEYALRNVTGVPNDDDDDDNDADSNDGYIVTSDWLPYHIVDQDLLKRTIRHAATNDYYENDSFLSRINYNMLEQIFTPVELTNLHKGVISNADCYNEQGGAFAAIPAKYRTYELCRFALIHDPSNINIVAAARDNFTDLEFENLLAMTTHPIDESFVEQIQSNDEENAGNNFRTLPFDEQ
jgi:hypothetical protein